MNKKLWEISHELTAVSIGIERARLGASKILENGVANEELTEAICLSLDRLFDERKKLDELNEEFFRIAEKVIVMNYKRNMNKIIETVNEDEKRFVESYRRLNPKQRKEVLKRIKELTVIHSADSEVREND